MCVVSHFVFEATVKARFPGGPLRRFYWQHRALVVSLLHSHANEIQPPRGDCWEATLKDRIFFVQMSCARNAESVIGGWIRSLLFKTAVQLSPLSVYDPLAVHLAVFYQSKPTLPFFISSFHPTNLTIKQGTLHIFRTTHLSYFTLGGESMDEQCWSWCNQEREDIFNHLVGCRID